LKIFFKFISAGFYTSAPVEYMGIFSGFFSIVQIPQGQTPAQIPLYDFCEGEQCIVNIASALSSTPAIATVQALTDVRGWLIPVHVIQRLIAESHAYQKTVFCLFTLRYSSLTTLTWDIKFKRLDSRILEYLRSFGTDEIAVKNSDIAEHLGTSRNVVNRVLQDLKNKNK